MDRLANVKHPEYHQKMTSMGVGAAYWNENNTSLQQKENTAHTMSGRDSMLPGLYRSGIQMNEIRFGIVADTAALDIYRQLAKCGGLISGDTDVYGTAFHVQAFGGYACGDLSQRFIRARGPEAGNDAEGRPGLPLRYDAMEQIQKVGVYRLDLSGAVITHDMTDPGNCTVD
jgi:hypothetical protein